MAAGVDTLNGLKSELTAIVNASNTHEMKPHTAQAARLLEQAEPGLSVELPGISIDLLTKYRELITVLKKGASALDGPKADAAMSDLKALARQALGQAGKSL